MIFPPEPYKECVKVSHVIFECRVINHHPTVSGRGHETMTHVPRDTHVTKQRMAMRSNFPWSDFKKLGTPELSSSSSTSTALSPKNFEKRALPTLNASRHIGKMKEHIKSSKYSRIEDNTLNII